MLRGIPQFLWAGGTADKDKTIAHQSALPPPPLFPLSMQIGVSELQGVSVIKKRL
jgi:hypothetical protein